MNTDPVAGLQLMRIVQKSVLPGFGLTLGFSVTYLSLLVLVPFAGLFSTAIGLKPSEFWEIVSDPRVLNSFKLTFGAAFLAASINMFSGFAVAWVLVRYRFPGRRLIDAMVDLPFALPTAVTGLALFGLYGETGWIGSLLPFQVQYTRLGVLLALTFIGLPFVVRTVQPALDDMEKEYEEVAASLGATRIQTFWKVILPTVRPAILTGFAMAFARALGEYGSVIFIGGTGIEETEIVSQLIYVQLNRGVDGFKTCSAIALVMLLASFSILLVINLLQMWGNRKFLVSR